MRVSSPGFLFGPSDLHEDAVRLFPYQESSFLARDFFLVRSSVLNFFRLRHLTPSGAILFPPLLFFC